ncbi:4'-phosphopantetheinyl transferase superfamily protein [Janthinobacterium rivuli]|uniref:Enterobactin synthase component D n=1 Tax=Janthinobacterium rivuli TaxID=2751478 RepID=A0ABY8I214_9BURK|nr:4'-phosphopantetheinyl transferase superfamily protein [Janthinobacterium rivuli]WFR78170.1 4'-phosphopantetheinyl transferase superfamily protein [Janthinobacterium rivuli]
MKRAEASVDMQSGRLPASDEAQRQGLLPLPLPFIHQAEDGMAPALQITVLHFQPYPFQSAAFHAHDIALPAAIARSVPKRQAEYFFGRLAARAALARLGIADAQIGTGASRQPLWPAGVVGSISHGGGYAAAVALPAQRHEAIGIDIEAVVGAEMREALLSTAIGLPELALLHQLNSVNALEFLMTVVFSAKESFFKAAFPTVGYYFDFTAVTLTAFDEARRTLTFRINQTLSPRLHASARFSVDYDLLDAHTVITHCGWRGWV